MINIYKGNLIRLRAYQENDIKKAYEYMNDYEVIRNTSPGAIRAITFEEERDFINAAKIRADLSYDFAIEDLQTGEYIGGCGIKNTNLKERTCELGILIGNKNYWGKGYGSDGIQVLLKVIFGELNFRKIKLGVFEFNKRAISCYEKNGFKIEGILKEELYREGKYHDIILMAMFKKDYYDKLNTK